jgi:hypothetical protein
VRGERRQERVGMSTNKQVEETTTDYFQIPLTSRLDMAVLKSAPTLLHCAALHYTPHRSASFCELHAAWRVQLSSVFFVASSVVDG